jgi:Lysyl oxidase/WD40-like Beta Propeller Repeat
VSALAALAFALAGIHVGPHRVIPVGYAPAWTHDGARLAYVTRGDLWVTDADGTHRSLLVSHADTPTWAPNGKRLAFTRDGMIWTVRADGLDLRRLAEGAHPAWSSDGNRIAFDRNDEIYSLQWFGGDLRHVATGTQPAYSAAGTLAYVHADGTIVAGPRTIGVGEHPTWSPSGGQIAYESAGTLYVDGRALGKGFQPAWRPQPRVRELLPDLVQRPPTGLVVGGGGSDWILGFTSMVDNVGLGPSMIDGVRSPGQALMTATQHVRLSNGSWRTYPGVGRLRYTNSPPHHHWHLMKFDVFQLRSLDGTVLMSDRKSGFCLADHWGAAPGVWPGRHAVFLGDCEQYHPEATSVVMGTSLGYTDRYPAFFHGQNVGIERVPTGVYDLVHRTNPNLYLHELRYENDVASVRVRLQWTGGSPSVNVLRSCRAATC